MLKKIAEELRKSLTEDLSKHPALILAENSGNTIVLNVVATALTSAYESLISTANILDEIANSNSIRPGLIVEIKPAFNAKTGMYDIWDKVAGLKGEILEITGGDILLWLEKNDGPYNGELWINKERIKLNDNVSSEFLDEMAAIATEFDKSEDPLLKKQAAVLDHILAHMSVPNGILWSLKQADNQEIDKIRQKRREEVYDKPRQVLNDEMKRSDVVKAIDNSVKSYRPMQHSLSTRYCPDHPGASLIRVGDNIFQCNLDRRIYDFKSGFTLLNGDKVPGGDVSGQTRFINDPIANNMSFTTRQSVLNE